MLLKLWDDVGVAERATCDDIGHVTSYTANPGIERDQIKIESGGKIASKNNSRTWTCDHKYNGSDIIGVY